MLIPKRAWNRIPKWAFYADFKGWRRATCESSVVLCILLVHSCKLWPIFIISPLHREYIPLHFNKTKSRCWGVFPYLARISVEKAAVQSEWMAWFRYARVVREVIRNRTLHSHSSVHVLMALPSRFVDDDYLIENDWHSTRMCTEVCLDFHGKTKVRHSLPPVLLRRGWAQQRLERRRACLLYKLHNLRFREPDRACAIFVPENAVASPCYPFLNKQERGPRSPIGVRCNCSTGVKKDVKNVLFRYALTRKKPNHWRCGRWSFWPFGEVKSTSKVRLVTLTKVGATDRIKKRKREK